jgi:imidazolonepropionase-like amidohydrolase
MPDTSTPASPAFIGKRFGLPAALLTGIMFPPYVLVQYKTGEWLDVMLALAAWAVLLVVYWLPVGALLFRWRGHWLTRLLVGYLVSIPAYFLALALVYRAFGYRFHPTSAAVWGTYFSATPTFYLMTVALYFLVRGGRTFARMAQGLAGAVFALSLAGTIVLWARTDKYTWPRAVSGRADIVHARIVDAAHARILDDQDVLVENGRIVSLVAALADRSDWPRIDARGNYLVPGLIDVHVHLQVPERSTRSGFELSYFLNSILGDYAPQRRAYLENGVTAIRSLGEPAAHIFALRAAVAGHKLLGPRILAAGRLVTSPHGHPASTIWTPQITRQGAILAASADDVRSGLEKNYAAGPPDAVKIIYGTIHMAHERLSRDLLNEAVRWAKGRGMISIVHIDTTQEAADAVASGATGVEHLASIERLPDELTREMAARGTFADPTFGEFVTARTLAGAKQDEIARELAQRYDFVRRLDQAGVPLTVGTDAPLVDYGQGLQGELAHYAKAGFTAGRILRFVTVNNAAYLGKANELGQIAAGYRADLLLVQKNPLDEIGALRKPVWVMRDGQIVVEGSNQATDAARDIW